MFCSSRWVAKLWRKVCGVTRLVISAIWAAAWQARVSWRVDIGLAGFNPGNSQPCGRPTRYQSRKSSSSTGESIAWRSLRPSLLDAQHHAFGIDVGHLQRDDLGNAQPRTIGDTERR